MSARELRAAMHTRNRVLDIFAAEYHEEFLTAVQRQPLMPPQQGWSAHEWIKHVVAMHEGWLLHAQLRSMDRAGE